MSNVTIPEQMLAWPLFGAGMENFGVNDQPCTIPVPEIKADELLVRIDAIGLCFSDVKLIRAGEAHPRVISKDLKKDPVIPGHEAVMTVVKVGDSLSGKFNVGERFIIQADIYVNGKGFAYGYAINGGMEQYSVIDQRILNGDEGCYLLPISEEMPSAVAALLEPWTCVQASYMIENRTAPLAKGRVFIAAGDKQIYTAGEALKKAAPSSVTAWGLSAEALEALNQELGLKIALVDEIPSGVEFDDIFLCNLPTEFAEPAAKLGSRGAVTSFIGQYQSRNGMFDVGRIHYEGFFYQGASGTDLSKAYGLNSRNQLKKGGTCWLPGGAGAMGQMHTQLAVENPDGPSRILVTDMDSARIANVESLLCETIARRGIEFKAVNPSTLSKDEFEALLNDFAPDGFDDIVMLVPVVPVLVQAAQHLGKDGLMNIFAGIPAGVEGVLSIDGIVNRNQRYIGSSGSRTEHLRHTLVLSETGKLNPVTALAAIGGMKSLKQGLEAVIAAKFPGKTVIFPNAPDMPLTPISEIAKLGAEIGDTLACGETYTMATELELKSIYEDNF
ncbi:MAG: alcohol dehydrogenase catalytic domain-containing protein [Victivallales bacterium]|jgi:threonine dehydrogenase-like Zn-dependent dehydrogenase|nr:alcohol dehydrogenase catalytic domain-containing protein [Victivallales bacterium]